MKLMVYARDDGQPVLRVEAESVKERKQLDVLFDNMHLAQICGIRMGKAGMGNPCGSAGQLIGAEDDGTLSLNIALNLGGAVESDKVLKVKKLLKKVDKVLSG